MSSETHPESRPETPIVGYCRACGKSLTAGQVRNAMGTIYCEEHVPATPPPPPGMPPGPPPGMAPPGMAYEANPYGAPPPVPQSDVSPGVAFVLGLIPGVGAIYNGQYAKGLVHFLVLALLIAAVNAADGTAGTIFGLMIPVFFFYMAFEAYHTARRRRMGLPAEEFSSVFPSAQGQGQRFPVAAVLLIALGTLFLLDNLDIVSVGRLISDWWPAILIGLGVYMLIARATGASSRDANPGPGPGGQQGPGMGGQG